MKFAIAALLGLAAADHSSPFYATEEELKTVSDSGSGIPTAVFHGFGDACINPGMGNFDKMLADGTSATVKCIEVGAPSIGEVFANYETVAEKSCE